MEKWSLQSAHSLAPSTHLRGRRSTGTLGRAAETIKSEPASTLETFNELEQLTGTRLFERGRLGAQLTLVGEQFLTHAVKVLDALNSAGQALNRKEGLNNDIVRIRRAAHRRAGDPADGDRPVSSSKKISRCRSPL